MKSIENYSTMLKNSGRYLIALIFSISIVLAFQYWQWNVWIDLTDEGFLWYGAQRVTLGETPLLDFASYDPGRYYWVAAFMRLFNDSSLISLRFASAVFQAIAIFVGILTISSAQRSISLIDIFYYLIISLTLLVWMYPLFRSYDTSFAILTIGVLSYLLNKKTNLQFFFTGFWLGLAMFFGRNHALYAVIATALAFAYIFCKNFAKEYFFKAISAFVFGLLTGLIPLVYMFFVIPNFLGSYHQSFQLFLDSKSTNIPLPIPWPWSFEFSSSRIQDLRNFIYYFYFSAIIVFPIVSIVWCFYSRFKNRPISLVFVSAAFVSVGYLHYALSRADIAHLAPSIFPFLIGVLSIIFYYRKFKYFAITIVLLLTSYLLMIPHHPGWLCRYNNDCTNVSVGERSYLVDKNTAVAIQTFKNLKALYAPADRAFLVTPLWPAAYPILEAKAPSWDIYAILPRLSYFEQGELQRITESNPGFALVIDFPLDGHEEMRFKNTHPYIHEYIVENFIPIMLTPSIQIYRSKDSPTTAKGDQK